MLKQMIALFAACGLLCSAAMAQTSNDEVLKRLEAIEKRLDQIERKGGAALDVSPLEQLIGKRLSESQKDDSGKSDLAIQPPPFTVELVSASPDGKNLIGQKLVKLQFKVRSEGERDAEIINASIYVKDKAGNRLANVKWEKSRGIGAGKTVSMSGSYASRDSDDGLGRLLEIDRSLIDVEFVVYKIVYKGGEVVEYQDCLLCDF